MSKNAIKILMEDHKKVKDMLESLTHTTTRANKKRTELLDQIAHELKIHTQIEEEIFYPAFRDAGKKQEKDLFFEALEEHRAVEDLVLPDLEHTEVDSDSFLGRAKVMKELIEHHVEEEEEKMFPKAKELFTEEELVELGARMEELKTSLQQSYA